MTTVVLTSQIVACLDRMGAPYRNLLGCRLSFTSVDDVRRWAWLAWGAWGLASLCALALVAAPVATFMLGGVLFTRTHLGLEHTVYVPLSAPSLFHVGLAAAIALVPWALQAALRRRLDPPWRLEHGPTVQTGYRPVPTVVARSEPLMAVAHAKTYLARLGAALLGFGAAAYWAFDDFHLAWTACKCGVGRHAAEAGIDGGAGMAGYALLLVALLSHVPTVRRLCGRASLRIA